MQSFPGEMRFEYRIHVACDDLGSRVTIRYKTDDGSLTDAVGTLEECDDATFGVRTKRGDLVRILRAAIVASKVIPPPPAPPTRSPPF